MFGNRLLRLFFTALTLLGLCCFLLGGCASQENNDLPKLVIGCDDVRPYIYTDENGKPAGMDVELAAEACRRMGYEPVFEQIEWKRRDVLLASGKIDCLWGCYSMDGQESLYAWVGPYMYSRQVAAVLDDSPIQHLSDLDGKTVAVRVSSDAESTFLQRTDESIPKVRNVFCLNDPGEAVTALRNGLVDACAGNAAAVREQFKNAGVQYRFLDDELSRTKLGVAFSKGSDEELRSKLSAALDEMLSDGTTARILQSYGVDTSKVLGGEENE